MTDDEFKKHLYKLMAEDKKNERVMTTKLYPQKDQKNKTNTYNKSKRS